MPAVDCTWLVGIGEVPEGISCNDSLSSRLIEACLQKIALCGFFKPSVLWEMQVPCGDQDLALFFFQLRAESNFLKCDRWDGRGLLDELVDALPPALIPYTFSTCSMEN